MTESEQTRADTLTLLLAYRINKHLPATLLMKKIRQCCEILLGRTHELVMINAYRKIISAIYDRRFAEVTIMLHMTEDNYRKVYLS